MSSPGKALWTKGISATGTPRLTDLVEGATGDVIVASGENIASVTGFESVLHGLNNKGQVSWKQQVDIYAPRLAVEGTTLYVVGRDSWLKPKLFRVEGRSLAGKLLNTKGYPMNLLKSSVWGIRHLNGRLWGG